MAQRTAKAAVCCGIYTPLAVNWPYFHYFGHVPYPSSKLMLKDARMLYGSAASSQD